MRVPTAQQAPAGLAVAGGAVAVVTVLPLVYLLLRASDAVDPLGLVRSERVLGFLWATLGLGLVVSGLALGLGVGMAWLLERTDLPARRALGVAAVLPLVVPSYVAALALKAAFGPAGLLVELPGIIGFWGAAAALALSSYPYVLLMSRAALASADPTLEEAARSLGDSRARALRRVVLPALRPALAASSLLVFLYVLSDFGAVSILQYDTLTRGIFLEYRSLSPDRSPAAVLGVVLVVVTLVAIAGERLARGRVAPSRSMAGLAPPTRMHLGRWRWPAAGLMVAVVAGGLGLPVGVLGYWATVGSSDAGAGEVLAGAATTSVGLAVAAALVAVAAAVPVALLAVRHRTRFARLVETFSFAGYALPGLVIALALVFFAAPYALYQTLALVVLAYVIRFLPEAIGSVRSSLTQVDPALEEAARSLGRRRLTATATVTLPLVRRGLLAGGALVFLTAMKELPATLVLRPPGTDTLAVRVWTGASEGLYAQAAPAALILVAVSALVLWPLYWKKVR